MEVRKLLDARALSEHPCAGRGSATCEAGRKEATDVSGAQPGGVGADERPAQASGCGMRGSAKCALCPSGSSSLPPPTLSRSAVHVTILFRQLKEPKETSPAPRAHYCLQSPRRVARQSPSWGRREWGRWGGPAEEGTDAPARPGAHSSPEVACLLPR